MDTLENTKRTRERATLDAIAKYARTIADKNIVDEPFDPFEEALLNIRGTIDQELAYLRKLRMEPVAAAG